MQKVASFRIKGMQRDLSAASFTPDYTYENKNIRLTPSEDNTLGSIINERGNKELEINGIGVIAGVPIGEAVLGEDLVLFTSGSDEYKKANIDKYENLTIDGITQDSDTQNVEFEISSMDEDRIYKFWFNSKDELQGVKLFEGDLNFDYTHPIEAIAFYENTDIRKVYWTDSLNMPRVINIAAGADTISKWTNKSFDFIKTLELKENVTITRNDSSNGMFAPGVIQYAFTYFNAYGQQSNIFYTSPLYYISFYDRGAAGDEKVNCSFDITIKNLDYKFDYVRVYSIQRTSINDVGYCKKVIDIKVPNEEKVVKSTSTEKPFSINIGPNRVDELELIYKDGSTSKLKDYCVYYEDGTTPHINYLSLYCYIKHYYVSISNTESFDTDNIVGLKVDGYFTIKFDVDNIPIDTTIAVNVVYNTNTGEVTISGNSDNVSQYNIQYYDRPSIQFNDNGLIGEMVDPTQLLYIGGNPIVVETINQKDNTLFLGNIKYTPCKATITKEELLGNQTIIFKNSKRVDNTNCYGSYYKYNLQINKSSEDIKTFKYNEYYRFGVQFQDIYGRWSQPVFLQDLKNDKHPEYKIVSDDNYQYRGNGNFYDNLFSKGLKDLSLTYDSGKGGSWNSYIYLPEAQLTINKDTLTKLYSQGFVKIRPVIVYPSINDRECICQGVLCPTVFNARDRIDNSPFAQPSWCYRPNSPFDIANDTIYQCNKNSNGTTVVYSKKDYRPLNDSESQDQRGYFNFSTYSRGAITSNTGVVRSRQIIGSNITYDDYRLRNHGSWVEFLHAQCLGSTSWDRDLLANTVENPRFNVRFAIPELETQFLVSNWAFTKTDVEMEQDYADNYFVDQSIVTLHSPELEWDTEVQNLDLSKLKLRIVGMVPITGFYGDIDIQASTGLIPVKDTDGNLVKMPFGFNKQQVGALNKLGRKHVSGYIWEYDLDAYNTSFLGWRSLSYGDFWFDGPGSKSGGTKWQNTEYRYKTYLWSKTGSLTGAVADSSGNIASKLDKKKISNVRFSCNTAYIDISKIWTPEFGISGAKLWNSTNQTLIKIPAPKNSKLSDIIYYGNIDKLQNYSLDKNNIELSSSLYKNGYDTVFQTLKAFNADTGETDGISGYDRAFTFEVNTEGYNYQRMYYPWTDKSERGYFYRTYGDSKHTEPVRIKYKSTPHAVIALNYSDGTKNIAYGRQCILPSIRDNYIKEDTDCWSTDKPLVQVENSAQSGNGIARIIEYETYENGKSYTPIWGRGSDNIKHIVKSNAIAINSRTVDFTQGNFKGYGYAWDRNCTGIYNPIIETGIMGPSPYSYSIQFGFLWLGELYRDEANITNRFGGNTAEAIQNNQWLPCGEPVDIISYSGKVKEYTTVIWSEGDTYYQRYDNLKTYPYTLEDINSVTDILSFMVETRINLDGRYDKNRGSLSALVTTPANFNFMNEIYSQKNNFFTYRITRDELSNFDNSITWTKTKTPGEDIDTWTNITLASILDLDGDKGSVNSIKRFNNELFAFQDRGLSQILYNDNMQFASTQGVPVEIGNSGKVNGKRYISSSIGCQNKWSICEGTSGLYFIDNISKSAFLFNGQLESISDKLGFKSWFNSEVTADIWNPVDFSNFVTYYDKINKDVLFINRDNCLAFSELAGQFSSFYSYEKTPYFNYLGDKGIAINTQGLSPIYKVWQHNAGEYNMFYGNYQPFYTTIVANPDMQMDKVFNNLEFRSDTWDNNSTLLNTTFDTLYTWNEYQKGELNLNTVKGRPSSLKQKFRIWRTNIPRSSENYRDRMRNPWLYLKLSMNKKNTNKTILHDMNVYYFE